MHDGTQYVLRERWTTAVRHASDPDKRVVKFVLSSGKRVAVNPTLISAIEEQ